MATYLASTATVPSSNGSSTVHSFTNVSNSPLSPGLMSPFRFPLRSQSVPRVPSSISRQQDTDDELFLGEENSDYHGRRMVDNPRTRQLTSDSAYDSGSIIEDDEDDDSEARPVEIEDIDERDLSFYSSPQDIDDEDGEAYAYDSDELNHQPHGPNMLLDQDRSAAQSSPAVFIEQDTSVLEEENTLEEDVNDRKDEEKEASQPPSAPNLSHSLPSPSLGMLESALSYLAAERERFAANSRLPTAPLESTTSRRKVVTAPVTPSRSFLPSPTKKKRQRKRKVPVTAPLAKPSTFDKLGRKGGTGSGEADESSSSVDPITTTTDAEKCSDPISSSVKSMTQTQDAAIDHPTHRGRTSQRTAVGTKFRTGKATKPTSTHVYPNYSVPVMQILKHSRSTPTFSRLSPEANSALPPEVEEPQGKDVTSSASSANRSRRKQRQRQRRLVENEVPVEEDEDKDEMLDAVLDDEEFNMDVLGRLTSKLLDAFPEDKKTLEGAAQKLVDRAQSSANNEGATSWEGEGGEPYYHVFIDHSNILIGMLNHTKKRLAHRGHHRYRSSNTSCSSFTTQSLPPTTILSKSSPSPYAKLSVSPEKSTLHHNSMSSSSPSPLSLASMSQNKCATVPTAGIGFTPLNTSSTKSMHRPYRKHLCHTALALLLERGRNVTRRVCVASSPLHQPKESVERLGYDFKALKRVLVDDISSSATPVAGGGGTALRNPFEGTAAASPSGSAPIPIKGGKKTPRRNAHSRKQSTSGSASMSYESDQPILATVGATPNTPHRPPPASHSASFPSASTIPAAPSRPRYHEQGVDELLQLKLHQSLNITDSSPPPGSTIILATGDGNAGEFNEEGFVGPVSIALRRGWRVELYAWEDGLSRVWKRVFEEWLEDETGCDVDNPKRGMFKIVGLEQFGAELVKLVL
jgi:hypothetical protein